MNGYAGRLLWVDLDSSEITARPLPAEYISGFMGGSGIGAKILFEMAGSGFGQLDPLSPQNPLIMMTGPLTGSGLPATGRLAACAKSPLTGIYAESSVGGTLGAALKFAGYDGVVITGAAQSPTYLKITPKGASLHSASGLWGLDTYESSDILLQAVAGEKGLKAAACIGPAGENLLPFACIAHNKAHFLGRAGMGAVMGSKKLKGLVVAGSKPPAVFMPEKVKALKKELVSRMKNNIVLQSLNIYGTNSALDLALFTGDVPIKNWTVGEWDEGLSKINGSAFDAVLTGRKTCYACPVACKREVEVKDEPYRMECGAGPEYETVASFGTMCLIDSVEALSKINDTCNRLGMDTITAGSTAALLFEAAETGLLDSQDLSFGSAPAVLRLLEDAAYCRDGGGLLAMAVNKLSHHLGAVDAQTTVKGLEAPMHDPRAGHGMGLAYATGYRGACHMSDLTMCLESGSAQFPGLGLPDYIEMQESSGKAAMVAAAQDFGSIVGGAAIFCLLSVIAYGEEHITESLRAVTGEDFTLSDLVRKGRRIWYLKRVLNNLCGISEKDDILPPRLLLPLKEGAAAGSVPEIEMMLREYYLIRRFNPDGKPSRETLDELGLGTAIPLLYPEA
jgi:aldehyde:ferredoxin oxidoreductase